MLTSAYPQIWRPCSTSKYCAARNFSRHYPEICDGYAAIENSLRKILTKEKHTELSLVQPQLYGFLRKITFELQENYREILIMNGKKSSRHVSNLDFSRLELPMKLSQYQCTILLQGKELVLKPFETISSGLGNWYLDGARILFPNKEHITRATLLNVITGVAALRCLLYAQFGPESELAISPSPSKGSGSGYYTSKSLFSLTSPLWPIEECYEFDYTVLGNLPITHYLI